jgi:hypothetical protein
VITPECDSVSCTDITLHTNKVNITLQGVNHLVNEMFDKITAFRRNPQMYKLCKHI